MAFWFRMSNSFQLIHVYPFGQFFLSCFPNIQDFQGYGSLSKYGSSLSFFFHKRKSIFVYWLEEGKTKGGIRVSSRDHVCIVSGHSKLAWLTVSFSAPHLGQWLSHRTWRLSKLLVTTSYPVTIFHIRWRIFCGDLTFQEKTWIFVIFGSEYNTSSCLLSTCVATQYPNLTVDIPLFV